MIIYNIYTTVVHHGSSCDTHSTTDVYITCSRTDSQLSEWVSEWVSRVWHPTWHITSQSGDKSFQAIKCTGTDNPKPGNRTKHYISRQHKRLTEKTALANITLYTLSWYAFYDLRPGKQSGPYSYSPAACTGHLSPGPYVSLDCSCQLTTQSVIEWRSQTAQLQLQALLSMTCNMKQLEGRTSLCRTTHCFFGQTKKPIHLCLVIDCCCLVHFVDIIIQTFLLNKTDD